MSKLCAYSLVFLFLTAAGVQADVLDMRDTDNASRFESGGKPTRGMTQARVEQRFGAPMARRGAVGDPPISSWEYDGFTVYFEYDKVIHSVTRR